MKKIMFLLPSAATSGGVQKSLSILTKTLSEKEKYLITVASLFETSENIYDYGKKTQHICGTLKKEMNLKKVFLKAKKECKKLVNKENIDVLVVESLGLLPLLPKKILNDKNIKIIVRDHVGYKNYKTFGLTWFGLKKAIKYIDYFIVLTEENKKEYLKVHPDLNNRIKVFPNIIEEDVVNRKYNSNSKKICFVGRLSTEKGAHLLIDAFSKVVERDIDKWQLDIYGSGEELENLKIQVKKTGMNDNINFKGHTNNIINLYENYSFLVVPSKYESFGIVILEALTIGIPVIAFDCSYGPRSLIDNEKNGLLVEKDNVEKMSNAIELLIKNKEYREYLASNTHKSVKKYSHSKIIKEWENVL